MRDRRFVAEHRGGPLGKQQQHDLLEWASACVKHVLDRIGEQSNQPLLDILKVGHAWKQGKASVGDARKAALNAIAMAKQLEDPVKIAITRAVGHVVAVAHIAGHSLKAADYALKAINKDGRPLEQQWQHEQLPSSIKTIVLTARK
ncbi:hypothetical protein IC230_06405 [Spirosoma sp. BT704]|uniref:Imm-5-like domain-containing protein n=1 Tax=Spirosoma validum TaxID=2771355 RepID=A0A927AZ30_9BACT|nr:hypothetical protein [Spirosoma validum]